VSENKYEVTAAGRAYTGGEEFRGNIRRILADLQGQGKSEEDTMTAAFVYTASCLVSEGPGDMSVDVDEMREFIQENQKTIRSVLVAALAPGRKG
jgi:hypothetical protein